MFMGKSALFAHFQLQNGRIPCMDGQKCNFASFQQPNGHVPRMPQSFITFQTKELFMRCLYMLKYFIILFD